jgi:putative SOS response-associated peptidase YedK
MESEMCGKFTQKLDSRLEQLSEVLGESPTETITPMRFADVLALDKDGARKIVRMRWGLVARGTPNVPEAKPHIHARAESIDAKPTFRDSFARHRGLILVSSFNEGEEVSATKTVQYVVAPADNKPIAIAIIWDRWQREGEPSLLSFAMVTVPANPLIATITDRMPALIEEEDWAAWLGEVPVSQDELKALLRPSSRDLKMQAAVKPPPPVRPNRNSAQPDLFQPQ